ncbi:MAG: hypothetical protein ACK4ME_10025, partial [Fimbriimonadales bacterium]
TIIGYAYNDDRRRLMRPFRWTEAGGFEMLAPGDATVGFYPAAVSSNGSVIIVKKDFANTDEALLRWTNTSGLQEIGKTPNNSSAVMSADGSVIVWVGKNTSGDWGLHRWTECATENLTDRFNTLFTTEFGENYMIEAVDAISPDGRYITGHAADDSTTLGFWLEAPLCAAHNGDVDNNGCVDDADLLTILFQFGQEGQCLGRVDVNCDDMVDDADLLIVLFNFGSGC